MRDDALNAAGAHVRAVFGEGVTCAACLSPVRDDGRCVAARGRRCPAAGR